MNITTKRFAIKTAILSLITISAVTYSLPSQYQEFDYYSDSTYTERVGGGSITCAGTKVYEGQKTPYRKIYISGSCGSYPGQDLPDIPWMPQTP